MSRLMRPPALVGLLAAAVACGLAVLWLRPPRADALLRQGRDALERGDGAGFRRAAEALERRGQDAALRLLRGEAWLRQGRAELARETSAPSAQERLESRARAHDALRRALAEFGRVADDGPLALEAALLAGQGLALLGERRLACELLTAAGRRRPDSKEAHRWLAAVYMDLNSPDDAIEHLRAWGELEPDNGLPFRWVGFFHRDYRRLTEAIAAYREALARRLEPAVRADAAAELAAVLVEWQADYRGALEALDGCPPEFRGRPAALALRAECLWCLGQRADALALLGRALAADPDQPRALLLRAKLALDEDQPRAALPFLENALRIDPHDHVSRQHLVDACTRLGDAARAAEHQRLLEQTRRLKQHLDELHRRAARAPWDDRVRAEIADVCLKLNRAAEARTWLRAALACNPDNGQAREALERVSQETGPPPPVLVIP